MGNAFCLWEGKMLNMPWRKCSVLDERMRFVIRLKDGETIASLGREFGISRKTATRFWSAPSNAV